jgi:hypothetical protein
MSEPLWGEDSCASRKYQTHLHKYYRRVKVHICWDEIQILLNFVTCYDYFIHLIGFRMGAAKTKSQGSPCTMDRSDAMSVNSSIKTILV